MGEIQVFDADAVLAAIAPARAIELTREAFIKHAQGDWVMPPKVYVDAPPSGDFRAMPARGDGLALLKWVTSFPDNPARGLPVVAGALLLSDANSGELLAIIDCASVTSLRTGAAAAVSAVALAPESARTVGLIGCGVNGAWASRCLKAAGYQSGICCDVRAEVAQALAAELQWETGGREAAACQDVVVTVTPGNEHVVLESDLRRGQHFAVLGADAHGKAEVSADALVRCSLFCDEWEQASAGGELSGAVKSGLIGPESVTEVGAVLSGEEPGRRSDAEITLFDSTGLAIQDLAIARAVYAAGREGRVTAAVVEL